MQKGMKVIIYDKWLTREGVEGSAILIRKISGDKCTGGERWIVKFENGDIRERNILPEEIESF